MTVEPLLALGDNFDEWMKIIVFLLLVFGPVVPKVSWAAT